MLDAFDGPDDAADGEHTLRVTVTAEEDEVQMHVAAENLGPVSLGTICVKTFSPFFSSQERLTQCRLEGDSLVRACDMPLPPELASSFGWTVGADVPFGAVVMRSRCQLKWYNTNEGVCNVRS